MQLKSSFRFCTQIILHSDVACKWISFCMQMSLSQENHLNFSVRFKQFLHILDNLPALLPHPAFRQFSEQARSNHRSNTTCLLPFYLFVFVILILIAVPACTRSERNKRTSTSISHHQNRAKYTHTLTPTPKGKNKKQAQMNVRAPFSNPAPLALLSILHPDDWHRELPGLRRVAFGEIFGEIFWFARVTLFICTDFLATWKSPL